MTKELFFVYKIISVNPNKNEKKNVETQYANFSLQVGVKTMATKNTYREIP